jgi:hypothetical protein
MTGRRRAGDGPGPVLSERQERILDFIQAYAGRHGVSPSYEPILGDGCRIMGKVVATLHSRRDRR